MNQKTPKRPLWSYKFQASYLDGNPALLLTYAVPFQRLSMVVVASCLGGNVSSRDWGTAQSRQKTELSKTYILN